MQVAKQHVGQIAVAHHGDAGALLKAAAKVRADFRHAVGLLLAVPDDSEACTGLYRIGLVHRSFFFFIYLFVLNL